MSDPIKKLKERIISQMFDRLRMPRVHLILEILTRYGPIESGSLGALILLLEDNHLTPEYWKLLSSWRMDPINRFTTFASYGDEDYSGTINWLIEEGVILLREFEGSDQSRSRYQFEIEPLYKTFIKWESLRVLPLNPAIGELVLLVNQFASKGRCVPALVNNLMLGVGGGELNKEPIPDGYSREYWHDYVDFVTRVKAIESTSDPIVDKSTDL